MKKISIFVVSVIVALSVMGGSVNLHAAEKDKKKKKRHIPVPPISKVTPTVKKPDPKPPKKKDTPKVKIPVPTIHTKPVVDPKPPTPIVDDDPPSHHSSSSSTSYKSRSVSPFSPHQV